MENIEQRVKKIVAEQLGVKEEEIKNESSFVDDLGADSLDTVELVMALEEEFETEIPDEEAEKIDRRCFVHSGYAPMAEAGQRQVLPPAALHNPIHNLPLLYSEQLKPALGRCIERQETPHRLVG